MLLSEESSLQNPALAVALLTEVSWMYCTAESFFEGISLQSLYMSPVISQSDCSICYSYDPNRLYVYNTEPLSFSHETSI